MSSDGYAVYPSLANKVVVVSGGAMGIGAAYVELFSVQGSQVVFLDINEDAAARTIEKVASLNVAHKPQFHKCDITNIEGEIQPTAAKILTEYPKVHVLINNAAAAQSAEFMDIKDVTSKSWDRSFTVNLRHQFFLTQALLPGLLAAENASVINMGSITWKVPATNSIAYTAGKAAVVGITRALAHELGPKGVRVNSILPGPVSGEVVKLEAQPEEYQSLIMGRQAIKRFLTPTDIARAALWLAAIDSAAVSNRDFIVDMGWT